MADKLRIGILGCGAGPQGVGSSRGAYLGVLAEQTGRIDTVAVCGIVREHVEYGAARMRQAQPFTDLNAFLNAGLDAIIIATPVYQHTTQAIACLEHGIPVLSEVTPVNSLTEAAQLAAAVERTGVFYMLAENYRFINEVELVKRMVDAGRFGRIHFAEGEYLHDTRDLRAEADGAKTWRGRPDLRGGLYCTHSLGPILYITGDRVATVACMEPAGRAGGPIMLMQSVQGALFKVRLDGNSPRPHNMAYYSVQGDRGVYESWRGLNDTPKIWLDDVHEPSRASAKDGAAIAQWHPLGDFAEEYIPDRLSGPEAAHTSGHFGADYWMLHAFADALLNGQPSPIDVYTALDYAVPGIIAVHSKANGGAPLPVPDFRPRTLPDV